MLFAESDPLTIVISILNMSYHKTKSFPIRWANPTTMHDVYDILYTRIFYPFSDILYIFGDDFPNLNSVIDRLKRWAITRGGSSPPRPSIMIVK